MPPPAAPTQRATACPTEANQWWRASSTSAALPRTARPWAARAPLRSGAVDVHWTAKARQAYARRAFSFQWLHDQEQPVRLVIGRVRQAETQRRHDDQKNRRPDHPHRLADWTPQPF